MSRLRHKEDCTQPREVIFLGSLGDKMLRCETCQALAIATPEQGAAPATQPAVRQYRNLVCRDHHDQAVTAKGKGCRKCEAERAEEDKP